MKIIFNNRVLDENDRCISPLCSGFNFGEGFFTTIKVIENNILHLNYHLERIEMSIIFFNFNLPKLNFENLIKTVLRENNLNSARVKIVIFKDLERVSFLISTTKLPYKSMVHELQVSKKIRGNDPIYNYKSLNYYNNLQNSNTIFKDHKERLLETGIANIFLINGESILTPPATLPLLPGVIRTHLLSLKNIGGYTIFEKEIYTEDLKSCDGFFITNSIRGIEVVSRIDSLRIPTDRVKNIQGLLKL
ncbi:hypothetical protein EW093_15230 [Thiospirochaeta perfilievii]|uniref:branched-chain-amino-acid transaminase n=1 Tax=Thiospirochaeta perfilievii TaxID=252967 RepID=A0A5C1QIB6_9SPIO|nr:aminotransferase class IV [Thiospirochaeta perfilievii]QEN05992.1 hypothetical protein EW093_15230 [Thiospirochaeta perfilievii]